MTGWIMSEHGFPESRLTVIERVEDHIYDSGKKIDQWLCECGCKEHKRIIVKGSGLRGGSTRSCGCLQREKAAKIGERSKKYNKYEFDGDIVIGYASNTNNPFYVDLKNFNKIKDYCWNETKHHHGTRLTTRNPETGKQIRMHVLLGFKNHDHIDRNALNNLESNLRPATASENSRNTPIPRNNKTGYIGVSWNTRQGKYEACIKIGDKTKHLGFFTNKEDAIRARLKAEKEYYGEFAPQQHLYEQYRI